MDLDERREHRSRVVVTGVGAMSAFGEGAPALRQGVVAGACALRELSLFDPSPYRSRIVGEVPPFEPPLPRRMLGHTSRADHLGVAAAREAVTGARLSAEHLRDAAVIHGTGTGGALLLEEYIRLQTSGVKKPPRSLLVPHQPATTTDLVAQELRAFGPRVTLMTACSSSAAAIGYAADLIRLGLAKVAIAGGTESLCRLTLAGFTALRALDPEPCRPFDARRAGLNLGEGSGMLVLEERAHALRRGVPILAEFAGYGVSSDAHHLTAPDPTGEGASRAMLHAMEDADLSPSDIDYVNAHGTGTQHNDPAETAAIKRTFGHRARTIPISSSKAMFGHTLGAAGALEAIVCIIALNESVVPPTLRLEQPDPACDLDYVPCTPRKSPLTHVLSNSFAFGGNNVALIFSKA